MITLASVATLTACGGSTANDSNTGGTSSGGTSSGGTPSGGTSSGGTSSGGTSSGGTSAGGSGGVASGCPATFPAHDATCSLPNGTSCSYSQGSCCPPWEAICQDGKWQALISSCNPPFIPCPVAPPEHGSACGTDPCGSTGQYCTYGQCADGSPYTIAQCTNGAWDVKQANCGQAPCEALTACECFDRPDCEAMSDSCICPCDYNCPGDPPCDCACGGGTYLGCKTAAGLP